MASAAAPPHRTRLDEQHHDEGHEEEREAQGEPLIPGDSAEPIHALEDTPHSHEVDELPVW